MVSGRNYYPIFIGERKLLHELPKSHDKKIEDLDLSPIHLWSPRSSFEGSFSSLIRYLHLPKLFQMQLLPHSYFFFLLIAWNLSSFSSSQYYGYVVVFFFFCSCSPTRAYTRGLPCCLSYPLLLSMQLFFCGCNKTPRARQFIEGGMYPGLWFQRGKSPSWLGGKTASGR